MSLGFPVSYMESSGGGRLEDDGCGWFPAVGMESGIGEGRKWVEDGEGLGWRRHKKTRGNIPRLRFDSGHHHQTCGGGGDHHRPPPPQDHLPDIRLGPGHVEGVGMDHLWNPSRWLFVGRPPKGPDIRRGPRRNDDRCFSCSTFRRCRGDRP